MAAGDVSTDKKHAHIITGETAPNIESDEGPDASQPARNATPASGSHPTFLGQEKGANNKFPPFPFSAANPVPAIPELTARIARAAFPKGNPYLRLQDELGTLFHHDDFADLYSKRGQPALPP
jgi:hypothetical protein